MTKNLIWITMGALMFGLAAAAAEYHVAVTGSDRAEGTAAKPWRTIQRAADVAVAGDVVTIHAGVYREWVRPQNAGRQDAPIVYQAAKGEKVVVTGADPVKGWTKRPDGLWSAKVNYASCVGLNPFNDIIFGNWYANGGRPRHRTRLIQNGQALELHGVKELNGGVNSGGKISINPQKLPVGHAALVPGMVTGTIYANFWEDPNVKVPELVTRPACFYPTVEFRDFQTLRGITFENAGPNWAPPTSEQVGVVGTNWSRGWVIEDCTVSGSSCTGITLGKYGDEYDNFSDDSQRYSATISRAIENGLDRVGHHVVRRCRIFDCGQVGICGSLGAVFSTVEDCEISHCHWKKPYGGCECGGIKIHGAVDFTIERCRIHHCGDLSGIYLDWMAQGVRISDCTLWANYYDLVSEVNHGPNLVEGCDLLSDRAFLAYSQTEAFVGNRIRGTYYLRDDPRRTPIFKPHTVELHSLDKDACTAGGYVFINNVLGVDPSFKRCSHPSRLEDNWMVPGNLWKVDDATGKVMITPPAGSKAPEYKPVTGERLGKSWVIKQEYPEPRISRPRQ